MGMNRRVFLAGMGWSAATAARNRRGKPERLACNSWPFRAYFDTPEMHEYRKPQYPLLTQADFPQFLADHFDIHNVEFLPQHFADTEPSTIEKVKAGLRKANSRCCNLMGVEIGGGVFTADAERQAVTHTAERWAGVAVELGCPSITVALTGNGRVDANVAARNLQPFVDVAQQHGLKVLFHNDDMQRESAEVLTAMVKALGRDKTGTCPDFGNFATKSAPFALEQLRMLAPYAINICHAKDGIAEHDHFYADDFPASMRIMHDTGFTGVYSLEFEGLGDPITGVQNLLQKTEEYLGSRSST
jgi:sugar phosphate isomerase/epimerase